MPFTYTPEEREAAMAKVLAGLREGTPLTVICSEEGMPTDDTIRDWGAADEELGREIARAREAGCDAIAIQALEIIDAEPERVTVSTGEDRSETRIDGGSVQWAKNRAWLRLQLLAKWDPKRYGDSSRVDVTSGDKPLPDLTDAAARIASLLGTAEKRRSGK